MYIFCVDTGAVNSGAVAVTMVIPSSLKSFGVSVLKMNFKKIVKWDFGWDFVKLPDFAERFA